MTDVHPHAELAARAAVAAHAQGRFWEMHDLLFARQDQLEFEDIVGYGAELGLDVELFLRDLESEDTAARVRADVASAEASGARGTPTFFIGNRRHTGPMTPRRLPARSTPHATIRSRHVAGEAPSPGAGRIHTRRATNGFAAPRPANRP
ncbi:MAG: DsbA family protein [Nocardioidaceae bacterium]